MQFPTLDFLYFFIHTCAICADCCPVGVCQRQQRSWLLHVVLSHRADRTLDQGLDQGHEMITKWSRRSWSAHIAHIAHGLCWMLDLLKSVCQSLSAPHFAGKKGKSKAGATAGDFVVTLWAHFGGSKVRGQCTNGPMDPQNWLWTQLWSNVFNCI